MSNQHIIEIGGSYELKELVELLKRCQDLYGESAKVSVDGHDGGAKLFITSMVTKLKISDVGLQLIKLSEGYRDKIYKDQAGLDTIGYGHLLTSADKASKRFENGLTESIAADVLRDDVKDAEDAVNDLVKVNLSQNQFDALVDFTFNLGRNALKASTLLKKLNAGEYDAVPVELLKWNKVRNPKTKKLEPSAGLSKRRQREVDLWSKI